jgi:D-psicose/D-tagatose/L-ribulose 3-epimerase
MRPRPRKNKASEDKIMKFGTLYAYWTSDWHGDYNYFAKKVKDAGFDILEISAGDLLKMSDDEIDTLKANVKDLGISISSNIGPPKDKDVADKDPAVRAAGVEFLTNIMKRMDRLDSRVLAGVMYTCWPGDFSDLDKPAIWARGVESVRTLGKTAENLGIDFCLEVVNRYETLVLNTCAEGLQFCDDVGEKSVKLLLDTFHMNIEENNIPEALRLAGDRLGHLHVGEGNRNLPGKGSLPWKEIGSALRDINYNRGIVMEPFVKMGGKVGEDVKVWRNLLTDAEMLSVDEDIAESVSFLRKAFLA